jgi:hybrid cluster-associated redox disulfide protein
MQSSNAKIKKKINLKTNIALMVAEYPQTAEVLYAFGLHCVGCFASQFDTIEQGAKVHGMMDEEVKELIKELNIVIKDSK